MKNIVIKYLFATALTMVGIVGCKDQDFKDGKIQSVDSQGNVQKFIGIAVTSTSNSEFWANARVPSTVNETLQLIPVAFSSKDVASEDIHVQLVPALDSLAAYNARTFDKKDATTGVVTKHPELYYTMPSGKTGEPAFTLIDNGLVTIPKGSSVGYLSIITKTADYFGGSWAYAYKIGSVQESGYTVSGNYVSGIVAVIPKNKYDAEYDINIETRGWAAYAISEKTPVDYGSGGLVTTGLKTNGFINHTFSAPSDLQPAVSSDNVTLTQFGAASPVFTFDDNDKLVSVTNSYADDGRGRAFAMNPAATAKENVFDADGNITLDYLMKQNGRPNMTIIMKLKKTGARK